MKIEKITIRNFRSIKSLEFKPSSICALVGENGAGKSNILAALDFLLGEKWPLSRNIEMSDYYGYNPDNKVFIAVELAPNSARVRSIRFDQSNKQKETQITYYNGDTGYLTNNIREQFALVYLEANRELDRHLGTSRWAIFGRILDKFDAQFPKEHVEELERNFADALKILRTNEFNEFEEELANAFRDQLRLTRHKLQIGFRAFDPRSYYRSLHLNLVNEAETIKPNHAGQGVRNLILIALFRAYAKVFKDDAMFAIEEPENYLHPHAERSLSSLFNEIAKNGNQIFYTTHSSNFVDIEHFDHICLVERCKDKDGDLCTVVKQVSVKELLDKRKKLHPSISMTEESLRERYYNITHLEHSEAFFARKIVLVEGESEEYAFPIFAHHLDYNFNTYGVSVVNAGGKNNLDSLYQLYQAFGMPVYIVFDNDRGNVQHHTQNRALLRMLGETEVDEPNGTVNPTYAILEGDFEKQLKKSIGEQNYDQLASKASQELGPKLGKGIKARYMARQLVSGGNVPEFIQQIIENIQVLGEELSEDDSFPDYYAMEDELPDELDWDYDETEFYPPDNEYFGGHEVFEWSPDEDDSDEYTVDEDDIDDIPF